VWVSPTAAALAADREIYRPVGVAGMKALGRFSERQLGTILEFLRTARKVQEDHAARLP
jgi:hypothetical protein